PIVKWNPVTHSDETLKFVNDISGTAAPAANYSTAPPLLPGIYMQATMSCDQPAIVEFQDVQLQLTYSYWRDRTVRAVTVMASGTSAGSQAVAFVSRPDDTGAQHSLTPFTRIFSTAAPVLLVVPSFTNDGGRFQGWFSHGQLVEKNTRLTLPSGPDSYR